MSRCGRRNASVGYILGPAPAILSSCFHQETSGVAVEGSRPTRQTGFATPRRRWGKAAVAGSMAKRPGGRDGCTPGQSPPGRASTCFLREATGPFGLPYPQHIRQLLGGWVAWRSGRGPEPQAIEGKRNPYRQAAPPQGEDRGQCRPAPREEGKPPTLESPKSSDTRAKAALIPAQREGRAAPTGATPP